MQRREVLVRLAAMGSIALVSPWGRAAEEGFTTLATPQPTLTDGRVEVLEFFSYGCPHCNHFEPILETWVKSIPSYIAFNRVPVSFGRQQWAEFARIYYTLDALGLVDKLNPQVFHAIHEEHIALHKEDVRLEWMASKGVDSKKFSDAYKSFGVQSRMLRGEQLSSGYRVDGVPLMAVAGKYLVSASQAGSYDALLKTVESLAAKERTSKGGA